MRSIKLQTIVSILKAEGKLGNLVKDNNSNRAETRGVYAESFEFLHMVSIRTQLKLSISGQLSIQGVNWMAQTR